MFITFIPLLLSIHSGSTTSGNTVYRNNTSLWGNKVICSQVFVTILFSIVKNEKQHKNSIIVGMVKHIMMVPFFKLNLWR